MILKYFFFLDSNRLQNWGAHYSLVNIVKGLPFRDKCYMNIVTYVSKILGLLRRLVLLRG